MPVPFNPPKSQIPNPKITPQARHPKPCPRPGLGLGQHPTTALRSLSRTRSSLRLCAPGGDLQIPPAISTPGRQPGKATNNNNRPDRPNQAPFSLPGEPGSQANNRSNTARHETRGISPLSSLNDTYRHREDWQGSKNSPCHAMHKPTYLTLPKPPMLRGFEAFSFRSRRICT